MMNFLADYGGTLAVGLVLAVIVTVIVVRLWRNHKKGGSSCGCGCDKCSHACGGAVPLKPTQAKKH